MAELSLLRKGQGISTAKLHSATLLRDIAAYANNVDSNSLTNSQVLNFLLTEITKLPHTPNFSALRYAFALEKEAKAYPTLSQRRKLLAQKLNKHPDTIIRYENQAIDELAARLQEAATKPEHTIRAFGTFPPAPSQDVSTQKNIMRDTAVLNIAGLLPVANRAPELVNYLEQSQRPYLEMNVEIKFLPSNRGKDWYRLEVKYTFSGMRDTFRLAIVIESEDGERLMTQGLVDDFYKLNNQIDPRQEIRSIINNSRFIAHNHTTHSQKLFRFHELAADRAHGLLESIGGPLKEQCRFLEIGIPLQWQNKDITYEYRSALNLRDDVHYAYWYAPSMMYLKKLVFDYSQFPRAHTWSFVVMPFLGNVAGESLRGDHTFTVRPNSWVMPGHGVALVWEAAS